MPRTVKAREEPKNTNNLFIRIASSAAMKKVLSPISEAKMSIKAARPPGVAIDSRLKKNVVWYHTDKRSISKQLSKTRDAGDRCHPTPSQVYLSHTPTTAAITTMANVLYPT
eukprot:scaffold2318_cov396-Prasinococcus_capsulatus_cf.AAC.7